MNPSQKPWLGGGATLGAIGVGIAAALAILGLEAIFDVAVAAQVTAEGPAHRVWAVFLILEELLFLGGLVALIVFGVRFSKTRPFSSVVMLVAAIVTAIPGVPCSIGLGITIGVSGLTS